MNGLHWFDYSELVTISSLLPGDRFFLFSTSTRKEPTGIILVISKDCSIKSKFNGTFQLCYVEDKVNFIRRDPQQKVWRLSI